MEAILKGIYGLYNAGGNLKTALTGGLHLEQAPQGTSMPYGTFFIVSGRPDYYLGGEMFEVIRVQFDLYAATNALRQTLYGYLTTLYDDARPSVTGHTSIIMERTFQQLLRDGDHGEYFRAIVEYELTVEK